MAENVAQMTPEELRQMIEAAVETAIEQKLWELLGDPDEGFLVRKRLREQLVKQQRAVAAGVRGRPLEDVVRDLELE
jgi:hypothetical protein